MVISLVMLGLPSWLGNLKPVFLSLLLEVESSSGLSDVEADSVLRGSSASASSWILGIGIFSFAVV